MQNRLYAFDCDGVTADMHTPLLKWHNRTYGTNHKFEDIRCYSVAKIWGCSPDEEVKRLNDFYKSKDFAGIPVLHGAIKGVRMLAQAGNRLLTVTARPEHIHEATKEWIDKHFPGFFSEIHFSRPHGGTNSHMYEDKVTICRRLGVDAIVEDSAHTALACYEAGIRAIVMNQPWNVEEKLPKDIERVKSWDELVELLI